MTADPLSLWKLCIQDDIDHFEGVMPERFAVAWRAHLAGFAEWGPVTDDHQWTGITPRDYRSLLAMIPAVPDDPAERLAVLRDGAPVPGRPAPMSAALVVELPERFAIAWQAYLPALEQEDIITNQAYVALFQLVPAVPGDPVWELFFRREY